MRPIVSYLFITLDGVVESPEKWVMYNDEMGDAINEMSHAADTLLLGGRTYDTFAASWPERTNEDDPLADWMNNTPKVRRLFPPCTTRHGPTRPRDRRRGRQARTTAQGTAGQAHPDQRKPHAGSITPAGQSCSTSCDSSCSTRSSPSQICGSSATTAHHSSWRTRKR